MTTDEERIALLIDYENLAIGAREDLRTTFKLGPVADALAERGRVVVRRAYADWSYFDDDRRMLTRHHVELIEIPQRMDAIRKNAADIKMAVDAIELCFERAYITTFVICTGDSDFTPLVGKLRELNRRVIGVGLKASTSKLLPAACDEFLFYESLEGVTPGPAAKKPSGGRRGRSGGARVARAPEPEVSEPVVADAEADAEAAADADAEAEAAEERSEAARERGDVDSLARLITQTLAGLNRSATGPVLASTLKRALLRKDPTFSEADFGFRGFGELLKHLESRKVIETSEGPARGDPEVGFPEEGTGEEGAFALLVETVGELETPESGPPLSGLKDQLRKRDPGFSEKDFGFSGFLQFCKAAKARGLVTMEWDEQADDYVLRVAEASPSSNGQRRGRR
ncbi:MAG TPA: NYN domain-containing protein [Euzebyales bacterium]|nr:NYN domain-containing protein [Euzebyales bacterium]